jgi:hypothetical protein
VLVVFGELVVNLDVHLVRAFVDAIGPVATIEGTECSIVLPHRVTKIGERLIEWGHHAPPFSIS